MFICYIHMFSSVVALADTEEEAITLAAHKALQFLVNQEATTAYTDTVEKIIDFFGVTAVHIVPGSAIHID